MAKAVVGLRWERLKLKTIPRLVMGDKALAGDYTGVPESNMQTALFVHLSVLNSCALHYLLKDDPKRAEAYASKSIEETVRYLRMKEETMKANRFVGNWHEQARFGYLWCLCLKDGVSLRKLAAFAGLQPEDLDQEAAGSAWATLLGLVVGSKGVNVPREVFEDKRLEKLAYIRLMREALWALCYEKEKFEGLWHEGMAIHRKNLIKREGYLFKQAVDLSVIYHLATGKMKQKVMVTEVEEDLLVRMGG